MQLNSFPGLYLSYEVRLNNEVLTLNNSIIGESDKVSTCILVTLFPKGMSDDDMMRRRRQLDAREMFYRGISIGVAHFLHSGVSVIV